jgi:DeoR/GlpR family transcriptional regulator of sugar metabolism
MLVGERRELLLTRLTTEGKVLAKDVAAELGVSDDSIRRDLRDLAAAGLCQRVYGGALPVSPAVADYTTRTSIAVDGKDRVAAVAAGLVRPGSTVILDGGTTTLAVTKALPRDLEATIVTHSPTIAVSLLDHHGIEVFLLGGRLFRHSAVTCGAAAAEAAQAINADVFLLGVTGVHPEAGLTTGDADEAAMKRTLARRAADTYVLASAEKFGAASRFAVLPFADVAGVITDADDQNVQKVADQGVPILPA